MKLPTEFLEFYNATFEFIQDNLGGQEDYKEYCEKILPILVQDLKQKVEKNGLNGAFEYWTKLGADEGGIWNLRITEEQLEIIIELCPTMWKIKTCDNYCKHCKWMYGKLFRDLGYEFEWEKTGDKSCQFIITEV